MGVLALRRIQLRISFSCILLYFFCFLAQGENKPLQLYEEKIKAGMVYNLLKYTACLQESNSQISGKLHICMFGDDPFDSYLSPLEGRTAQQIPIFITHITHAEQADSCSVVIIHRAQEEQLDEVLS